MLFPQCCIYVPHLPRLKTLLVTIKLKDYKIHIQGAAAMDNPLFKATEHCKGSLPEGYTNECQISPLDKQWPFLKIMYVPIKKSPYTYKRNKT